MSKHSRSKRAIKQGADMVQKDDKAGRLPKERKRNEQENLSLGGD
ncbi:hypothetical protein WD019_00270 [Fictibacillus sp. Mic-4]|nr:hypothetical protein [Fictibacillus gelatini]